MRIFCELSNLYGPFHAYRGTLRNPSLVSALIAEVEDIASSLHWRCRSITGEKCKGVNVSPENCEPVVLCFYPDTGILRAPWDHIEADGSVQWIHTKTQYAGMEVHVAVIKLLRYLSEKYFAQFELHDEGQYWETGSEDVLRRQWARYEVAMEMTMEALLGMKGAVGESAEGLAKRIEQVLRERMRPASSDEAE